MLTSDVLLMLNSNLSGISAVKTGRRNMGLGCNKYWLRSRLQEYESEDFLLLQEYTPPPVHEAFS